MALYDAIGGGGTQITYLFRSTGSTLSFNVQKLLPNWATLTAKNFFIVLYQVTGSESSHGSDTPGAISFLTTLAYNSSTGVVSTTLGKSSKKGKTQINAAAKVDLYYISTPLPTVIGESI